VSHYPSSNFGYLQQVEAYFLGLTQVGLMLSARDVRLACQWRDGGVPVETVCRGLRVAFERHDTPPRSIWHCRKFVEVEVAAWRDRAAGSHAPEGPAPTTGPRVRALRDPTRVPGVSRREDPPEMPGVWTRSLERLNTAGKATDRAAIKNAYRAAWRAMTDLAGKPGSAGIALAIFEIEAEFFDAVFDSLTHAERHVVDVGLAPALVGALAGMSPDARRAQLRVWRRPMLAELGAVSFFEP
jgi:hypothetical protein